MLITTNEADSGLYVEPQQASVDERVRSLCSEVEYDAGGNWTSLTTCGEFPKHDSWTHWEARNLQRVESSNLITSCLICNTMYPPILDYIVMQMRKSNREKGYCLSEENEMYAS